VSRDGTILIFLDFICNRGGGSPLPSRLSLWNLG